MKKFFVFLSIIFLIAGFGEVVVAEDLIEVEDEIMGKVFMRGEFLDDNILKVDVIGEGLVRPVIGSAFNLKYEGDRLAFLRYDPGEFLERGGDPFYLVKNFKEKEDIVFGVTLKREDSFPMGSGKITSFYFEIIGEKKFYLKFDHGVVSTMETVRQDLDRIVWEDLMIDDNNEGLIKNGGGNGKTDPGYFPNSRGIVFWIIGIAFGVALCMIFLLNKSTGESVNFK